MVKYIKPPDKEEDVMAYLRFLYLKTEQRLIHEIKRKRAHNYVDYAEVAALERTQKILQDMVDNSWDYIPAMLEKIFYKTEKAAKGYANARSLTIAQTSAIQQLSNNLLGEVMEASASAQKSVEKIFLLARQEEDALRKAALKTVTESKAAGYGARQAKVDMEKILRSQGITSFTDKAGRKWSLSDYCNMATRTTARQAQVAAILTADPGHDLYKIVKIGATCPVCAPLEGRVYSRSGTNPEYPALTKAFGKIDAAGSDDISNTYLNIHPNCLHSIVKYTTIGKSEGQIQKDKDFSSFEKNPITNDPRSKKQIEAYRKKIKDRQKLLNDRKQYQKYQKVIGNDLPKTFEQFRKHKLQNDDTYKKWKVLYRNKNLQQKSIRALKAGGEEIKGIPKHPLPVLRETIDIKNENMIQSTLEKYEKEICSNNNENAIVVTKSGKVKQCFGNDIAVYPDVDLEDEIYGAYITHNHPINKTNFSFSSDDISLFMDYKLPILRGIDNDYVYQLTRLPDTIDINQEMIKYLFGGEFYHNVLNKAFTEGILLDTDEYHEIVKMFAEKYHFHYERWERK